MVRLVTSALQRRNLIHVECNLVLSRLPALVVNGDDITIVVENFEGLIDTDVKHRSKLADPALDRSGVAGAMQVLESVAAEGRERIERERERSASVTGRPANAGNWRAGAEDDDRSDPSPSAPKIGW
ncbi:hypothetical protein ABZ345_02035 [Lentzea sp. NPDC005914]|uniref:hypothetical protein n=1 Tax=Lentzea sp. NPDC005914 TaxID=3154572 RepID=UPI0033CD6106